MRPGGVYLPIITPFTNGEVDEESYVNLINYYIPKGITGIIPLGTTGESPVVSEKEFEKIVDITLETVNNRLPVYIGLGGNDTDSVLKRVKLLETYNVNGILSVCPYYNRPGQNGLFMHFKALSEATDLDMIIYNIPYRTGVNLENDTLFKLAELKNIVGVKDSCGIIRQSLELLSQKPDGFSVLTGEDLLFYTTLVNGGNGGILASAHLQTETFIYVYTRICDNDFQGALQEWRKIDHMIPMLFEEPNPGPVKYCLKKLGLILSSEVRLPLTGISDQLKNRLDNLW